MPLFIKYILQTGTQYHILKLNEILTRCLQLQNYGKKKGGDLFITTINPELKYQCVYTLIGGKRKSLAWLENRQKGHKNRFTISHPP